MQIITDRRSLHRIPELELQLPKTMEYLTDSLKGLRCRVFSPMESSLCAFFDFGADDAIAFRADCDALPIQESGQKEYASTHPGKMHACGHDGHMSILLELARRLSEKEHLPHNVLLVFQPGEERPGGAKPLCETGILEQHKVKAIFGLHLWPGLEAGKVHSREQELMARASELTVDVYGKSSHIARPDKGIDALIGATAFYTRMIALEKSLPPHIFRLLNFGKFHSGTARNALSAHAHMEGSLRTFQDEVFDQLKNGLFTIAADVEAETGCKISVHLAQDDYPAVINPSELFHKVYSIAPFEVLREPSMTAEDFSQYQKRVPGMFFFLGLGDTPPLHACDFDFDEFILTKGADFFETLAEKFI